MNSFREKMLKEQETTDLNLFDKIKNNLKPDIHDLWSLSPDRFIEWRKLNDFPVLFNHFDKTLSLFKEWKIENKLTNEIIIRNGELTPFLENKKGTKDKRLFLINQNFDNSNRTFVSYIKIEGEKINFDKIYNYEVIQSFTSYLDWLEVKGKKQEILYINSRHSPNSIYERVFIHADVYSPVSDFELLKMGGIEMPVNPYGILYRGKKLEFVNLCGLKLKGEVYFGELGNLSCSYCACDNWEAENLSMPMLDLEHCTLNNFLVKNSSLNQWTFYNCSVSGDIINTKLNWVNIVGGNFQPILQDCALFEVDITTDNSIVDNNLYAYKTFKKIYANQGDDDKAKYYFIRENEYIRKRLKRWNYFTKSLSYFYWEYGRKPHRIIYISIVEIFLFGIIYWLNGDLISLNSPVIKEFHLWDGFYFSITTFTTLGYGDLCPLSGLRILSSIEAFLGVINMGFLIAGYSNNKY